MKIDEILKWMSKEITYWYVKNDGVKEVVYPAPTDQKEIVESIFREDANMIIYKNNFYYIEGEFAQEKKKVSCIYYMRKASSYRRKQAVSILPYSLRDKDEIIVQRLIKHYNENSIPYELLCTDKDVVSILNSFTYLDIFDKRIILHKDVYYTKNNKLIVLLTSDNRENLSKKIKQINSNYKIYEIIK